MSYGVASAQINGFRGMMVYLGLGSPIQRAIVAGALASGISYVAKMPRDAFDEDGRLKKWAPMSIGEDTTDTHFLMCPLAAAALVFVFT